MPVLIQRKGHSAIRWGRIGWHLPGLEHERDAFDETEKDGGEDNPAKISHATTKDPACCSED